MHQIWCVLKFGKYSIVRKELTCAELSRQRDLSSVGKSTYMCFWDTTRVLPGAILSIAEIIVATLFLYLCLMACFVEMCTAQVISIRMVLH